MPGSPSEFAKPTGNPVDAEFGCGGGGGVHGDRGQPGGVEDLHRLDDGHGHGDLVPGGAGGAGGADPGQVGAGVGGSLDRGKHELSVLPVEGEVDGLGSWRGRLPAPRRGRSRAARVRPPSSTRPASRIRPAPAPSRPASATLPPVTGPPRPVGLVPVRLLRHRPIRRSPLRLAFSGG